VGGVLARKISLTLGKHVREFEVIEEPCPHILIESRKELHGWYKGKRECTGERMLINPYNGCSVGCMFCYARALPSPYFRLWTEQGIVTVARDFDRVVADQLDSISVASCGYLSPVSDPFQEVDSKYRLSEKIIEEFVRRNIPVQFTTKCEPPDTAVGLMKTQRHSFCQFSFVTGREEVRVRLMTGGATVDGLLGAMERAALAGLPVVMRIDPVIPYLTDSKRDLASLLDRGIDSGAGHIVTSVMDIPVRLSKEVFANFSALGVGFTYDLGKLYTEVIDGYLHAAIDYRKRVFDLLRDLCEARGVTLGLCMEYEVVGGKAVGLNETFMSSSNCEGADIPIYTRAGEKFVPAASCDGACLRCVDARCGIEDLAMGLGDKKKDFALRDYRRWTRTLEGKDA
jgi:DNA repair photolyase